jgi:hypothetical protein
VRSGRKRGRRRSGPLSIGIPKSVGAPRIGKSRRKPRANPAHIAFNNKTKSLLVTNHASLTGLPDPSFLFAVFDVYVNDKAGKLFESDDD